MSFGLKPSGGNSFCFGGSSSGGGDGGGGGGSTTTCDNDAGSGSTTTMDPSTPWTAIADGNLSLLQQSLQQLQYPIYVADEIQGYTLLQAAASYNHLPILQYVWSELEPLNHPANTTTTTTITVPRPEGGFQNAIDHDGDTALHYAGSVQSIQFLIDTCHINVHIQNNNNLTALDEKRNQLKEMEQDEDNLDDAEYQQLQQIVQFLEGITMNPQSM
jgi:ankyrin repeat protein